MPMGPTSTQGGSSVWGARAPKPGNVFGASGAEDLRDRRLAIEAAAWPSIRPTGFQLLCQAGSANDNATEWTGFVPGPQGSAWEGGLFVVSVHFSPNYPNHPPRVCVVPPIFHPNVAPGTGWVSLHMLMLTPDGWQPSTHVQAILVGIQEVLREPDMTCPSNAEAYAAYMAAGRKEYLRRAAESTRKAAPPPTLQLYRQDGSSVPQQAEASSSPSPSAAFNTPDAAQCEALFKKWSARFDAFMNRKKDPAHKDAFKSTLQPIHRVLVGKARNGPPRAADAMTARQQEMVDVLGSSAQETLEFALLCILKTSGEWLRAVIPDTAEVSLPSNVGTLAAVASKQCTGAFDFDRNFVSGLAALPHGHVVLPDLADAARVHGAEPWAGQDKVLRQLQIVTRAYFCFIAGMLPANAPVWSQAAFGWLVRACDPAAMVPCLTCGVVVQFLDSLQQPLQSLDANCFREKMASVKTPLTQRLAMDRQLIAYRDEGGQRVAPDKSPEKLAKLLDRLEEFLKSH
eukprot:m.133722 g.133722  ORF g.133722 m.133722 type:complete len:513 (+) comp11361_c0_seq4:357-1895(+)